MVYSTITFTYLLYSTISGNQMCVEGTWSMSTPPNSWNKMEFLFSNVANKYWFIELIYIVWLMYTEQDVINKWSFYVRLHCSDTDSTLKYRVNHLECGFEYNYLNGKFCLLSLIEIKLNIIFVENTLYFIKHKSLNLKTFNLYK